MGNAYAKEWRLIEKNQIQTYSYVVKMPRFDSYFLIGMRNEKIAGYMFNLGYVNVDIRTKFSKERFNNDLLEHFIVKFYKSYHEGIDISQDIYVLLIRLASIGAFNN